MAKYTDEEIEYYGFREPLFRMSLSHISGRIEPLLRPESHPNYCWVCGECGQVLLRKI